VSDRSRTVSRRLRKQKQVRLSDEELDVVIAAYQDGLTLNELASAFGPDRRTLSTRLKKRGVERRGRRLSDEQIREAIGLYAEGWSTGGIGELFGVRPSSVWYRLKQGV
jgi:DNA-directed RNA polymerase specialized sigma24 family protein